MTHKFPSSKLWTFAWADLGISVWMVGPIVSLDTLQKTLTHKTIDRLSKNWEKEEEEENTITFRLKCIVIA